jgi:hypothetical protein
MRWGGLGMRKCLKIIGEICRCGACFKETAETEDDIDIITIIVLYLFIIIIFFNNYRPGSK